MCVDRQESLGDCLSAMFARIKKRPRSFRAAGGKQIWGKLEPWLWVLALLLAAVAHGGKSAKVVTKFKPRV